MVSCAVAVVAVGCGPRAHLPPATSIGIHPPPPPPGGPVHNVCLQRDMPKRSCAGRKCRQNFASCKICIELCLFCLHLPQPHTTRTLFSGVLFSSQKMWYPISVLPSNRHPMPSNRHRLLSNCRQLPSNRRWFPSNHCSLLCNRCLIVRLNNEPATGRPNFFSI